MKVKSEREIQSLKQSGMMLRDILMKVIERANVGVTGRELASYAGELIRKAGGTPAFTGYGTPPFPSPLCVSVNACIVHGIPSDVPFAYGDIVGFDIGMIY